MPIILNVNVGISWFDVLCSPGWKTEFPLWKWNSLPFKSFVDLCLMIFALGILTFLCKYIHYGSLDVKISGFNFRLVEFLYGKKHTLLIWRNIFFLLIVNMHAQSIFCIIPYSSNLWTNLRNTSSRKYSKNHIYSEIYFV